MGIQRGGGILGKRATPNVFAASGVWSLSEAESSVRGAIWPVASPVTSGLVLWLDGADVNTMFDATSGGNKVAANGAVSRWEDKSGGARHFTQATSGLRPTRRDGVKNGLGAVGFANGWMSGTFTYTVGTIFTVWNHPTTVAGDAYPAIVSSRTASSFKTGSSTLNYDVMLPSSTNVAVDPSPGNGTNRLNGSAVVESNFGTYSLGLSARSSPDRWNYLSSTFTAVTGSKAFVVGADTYPATGRWMQNGHIGEILMYSGALTTAQVIAVESYLITKWGLA